MHRQISLLIISFQLPPARFFVLCSLISGAPNRLTAAAGPKYLTWNVKIAPQRRRQKYSENEPSDSWFLREELVGAVHRGEPNRLFQKEYVKLQISVMGAREDQRRILGLCDISRLPFLYHMRVSSTQALALGRCMKDFTTGKTVAVDFQVRAQNFRMVQNPGGAVDDSFRLGACIWFGEHSICLYAKEQKAWSRPVVGATTKDPSYQVW